MKRPMSFSLGLGLLLVAACAALVASYGRAWRLPDRHNPFAPLSLAETPNWLTRHKLARLDHDRGACLSALAQSPFLFDPVPDRDTGDGCGVENAVRVRRTQVAVGTPFTLSCPAAVSLALWERHALMPAARQQLGTPITRLDHFGSYACRNVYGREAGRRSQHATAQAFDLAGVTLSDGRRITVARHWRADGGTPEAAFLQQAHAGGCRFFDAVLGPAYNAAHADHFHLDRGPWRACR